MRIASNDTRYAIFFYKKNQQLCRNIRCYDSTSNNENGYCSRDKTIDFHYEIGYARAARHHYFKL